jgi:heme A synthase
MRSQEKFPTLAWWTLVLNVFVSLWGAVVRASGSGAGCGAHWPTCDGEIVPGLQSAAQWIEYTHRLSSGLALLAVLWMLVWAYRAYAPGHPVRKGVTLAMAFMISESLVGAMLVLFGWVEADDSLPRVYIMGVHLTNTLMLLGYIFLTAYWASGRKNFVYRGQKLLGWLHGTGGLLGLVLVVTGAIIALGDSLIHTIGLTPEQSPVVAGILTMRLTHPYTSIAVGVLWMFIARYSVLARPDNEQVRKAAWALTWLIVATWAAGYVNNWLHAPTWLQVVHLLLADLFWLGIVWLSAETLSEDEPLAPQVALADVFQQ